MIQIEKNLEQLCSNFSICEKSLIDNFSIKIQLGSEYYSPVENRDEPIIYGSTQNTGELFHPKSVITQNLTLLPGQQVLTCSKGYFKIPHDYFGIIQTKGTLARLFVMATCNDGQVEPGFEGHITLEIVNLSPWKIQIPIGSDIAQMYLAKCSSHALNPYNGRYAQAAKTGTTLPIFS